MDALKVLVELQQRLCVKTDRDYRRIPRIECADGFSLSVQASPGHYCTPRIADGPYCKVEVGFPSEVVMEFMPFIDGDESTNPTETVYGYVPIDTVAAVIARHGGFLGGK